MKKILSIILGISLCVVLSLPLAGCEAIIQKLLHVHNYNQEVVSSDCLKSEATCSSKAEYYYSCSCGKISNLKTFEAGEPLGHEYGEWISNGDGSHSKVCLNNDTHILTEDCYGGVATCAEKAICVDCGEVYGSYSNHEYGEWISNGDGTHSKVCVNDYTHKETEDCHGGESTCTQKAICDDCGVEYGSFAQHIFNQQIEEERYLASSATCEDSAKYYYSCLCGETGTSTFTIGSPLGHNYSAWVSNGDGTHSKVCVNDYTHKETEDCHGGNATCTQKAICDDCGVEYGSFAQHIFNQQIIDEKTLESEANCKDKAKYYYSCICGEIGEQTFEVGETNAENHIFLTDYEKDEENHWHKCSNINCNEITTHTPHEFVDKLCVCGLEQYEITIEYSNEVSEVSISNALDSSTYNATAFDNRGNTLGIIVSVKEGFTLAEGNEVTIVLTASSHLGIKIAEIESVKIYGNPTISYNGIEDIDESEDPTLVIEGFTVTFDANFNKSVHEVTAPKPQIVNRESNLNYVFPSDVKGYSFTGWYTTPECETVWDFANPVSSDMTLYAGWTEYISDIDKNSYVYNNITIWASSSKVSVFEIQDDGWYSSNNGNHLKENVVYFTALKDSTFTVKVSATTGSDNFYSGELYYSVRKYSTNGSYTLISSPYQSSLSYNPSSYTTRSHSVSLERGETCVVFVEYTLNKVYANYSISVTSSNCEPASTGKVNQSALKNGPKDIFGAVSTDSFGQELEVSCVLADGDKKAGETCKYILTATDKLGNVSTKDVYVKVHSATTFSRWNFYQEPTCTSDGHIGYYYCDECGLYFDEDRKIIEEDVIIEKLPHEFTEMVETENYFAYSATCESGTAYYYSCICGEKGTTIFHKNDALGHDYGEWQSVNNGVEHYKVCSRNNSHIVTENCNGGNATCTNKAVCKDCNVEYGEPLGHNYSEWISNGNDTHTKTCIFSDDSITENCNGGNATCTNKAVCKDCNVEYGEPLGHNYTLIQANGDGTHTKTCSFMDDVVTENCYGGVANCTNKAICECCGLSYGDYYHIFDQQVENEEYFKSHANCEEGEKYYYSCACGEKGTQSFVTTEPLGHEIVDTVCTRCNKEFGLSFELSEDGTHYLIAGIGAEDTSIEIPSTHWGLPVRGIKGEAFYNQSIVSIEIPSSITYIKSHAFYGCNKLTTVNYLGDLNSWIQIDFTGDYSNPAYYAQTLKINNETIKNLNISNVSEVKPCAFSGYKGLKSLDINATKIGTGAFRGCSSLTTLTIGENVSEIEGSAFSNCAALTQINYNAISCANLDSYNYVFSSAGTSSSGIAVTFSSTVAKIPAYLFGGNGTYSPNVKSITIQDNTANMVIGASAFLNCKYLQSVSIGSGVSQITKGAFEGCSKMESIVLSSDCLTEFGSLFGSYNYLDAMKITQKSGSYYYVPKTLKNITINTSSIASNLFYGCDNITTLTIGEKVKTIGDYAFAKSTYITTINFNAIECNDIDDRYSYIFYNVGKNTTGTKVNVGTYVKYIPEYLFAGDKGSINITNVEFLGVRCTEIRDCAFYYLSSLKILRLPNSLQTIGVNAFYGCESLSNLVMYVSLQEIGSRAFQGCTSLVDITMGAGVKKIGTYAFYQCSSSLVIRMSGTWYRTNSYLYTGGTKMTVTNSSTNGKNLTNTYASYYWYKA